MRSRTLLILLLGYLSSALGACSPSADSNPPAPGSRPTAVGPAPVTTATEATSAHDGGWWPGQNVPVHLEGAVVDSDGDPIKGVKMSVYTGRVTGLVPSTGPFGLDDRIDEAQEVRTVDGAFDVRCRSAAAVTLDFQKEGHYRWRAIFHAVDGRPLTREDLRIVLPRRGPPQALSDYSVERPQNTAVGLWVDFGLLAERYDKERTPAPTPETTTGNALLCAVEAGDDGRPLLRPIGRSVGTPGRVTLRFSAADGGFVRAEVGGRRHAGLEMMRAPADGDDPELRIDPPLKDQPVYFYFRCGGKYGRGMVYEVVGRLRENTVTVGVWLRLQPDGTRNLETGEERF